MIVHPSRYSATIILVMSIFISSITIGTATVLIFRHSHKDLLWIFVGAGAVLGWTPLIWIRTVFTQEGVASYNGLRRFSAPWSEVKAIMLQPSAWYTSNFGWASSMLYVETRSGKRFPLRSCSNMAPAKTAEIEAFLRSVASAHGIALPFSFQELSRKGAVF